MARGAASAVVVVVPVLVHAPVLDVHVLVQVEGVNNYDRRTEFNHFGGKGVYV